MPYDPAQFLAPYLQPTSAMLPQILAQKLARERLAQQEEQFKVKRPGIEMGVKLGEQRLKEAEANQLKEEQARQAAIRFFQGGVYEGKDRGVMPEDAATLLMSKLIKVPTEPKTQPVWNETLQRWIHGQPEKGAMAKPKAKPDLKPVWNEEQGKWVYGQPETGAIAKPEKDIQAEAKKRAMGAALGRQAVEKEKKPTKWELLDKKRKILKEKASFEETGLIGGLLSAALQSKYNIQVEADEKAPENAMASIQAVWQEMIDEVDRQMLFYGYTQGKPTAPQAAAPSVDSYIKRKLKK